MFKTQHAPHINRTACLLHRPNG